MAIMIAEYIFLYENANLYEDDHDNDDENEDEMKNFAIIKIKQINHPSLQFETNNERESTKWQIRDNCWVFQFKGLWKMIY